MALTDAQSQELMDSIINKCDRMGLSIDEIIDGLGRAMLSATQASGNSGAIVRIENFGICEATLTDE